MANSIFAILYPLNNKHFDHRYLPFWLRVEDDLGRRCLNLTTNKRHNLSSIYNGFSVYSRNGDRDGGDIELAKLKTKEKYLVMEVGCWTMENQEYKSVICTNIANDYSEIEPVEQYSNEFVNFQTNFDSTDTVCGRIVKKESDLYSIQEPMLSDTVIPSTTIVKSEQFEVFENGPCMRPILNPLRLSPLSSSSEYGSVSSPRHSSTSSETADPGMELYHDLIMQHLVKDIQVTCKRLRIPSDPRNWSVEDTQRWLINVANQYQLAEVPFQHLSLPGQILCSMGREVLKQIFPTGGELVHAQMNVWVTANDYYQRCQVHQGDLLNQYYREEPSNNVAQLPLVHHQSYPAVDVEKSHAKFNRPLPMLIHIDNPKHIDPDLHSPTSDSGISIDSMEEMGINCETPNVIPDSCNGYIFKSNIHLWQFLRELLADEMKYGHYVRWLDRSEGVFKIEDSHKLAKLWGQRKHRPAMNYDKLSRSLRQYYRKGILKKTLRSQRLVYQFLAPYHTC